MAFAVLVDDPVQLVDVEAVLDAMVSLARDEVRQCARLIKRYARVPAVRGDEHRLRQLFLNLILSTARSIAGGTERRALTLSTALDGNRVVIEVAEAVVGVDRHSPTVQFEPLSPSPPTAPATRSEQALVVCQGIVASHGGEIKICTLRGQGAIYQVSLPVAEPAMIESPASSEMQKTASNPRARILIVDDEPLLGQTLTFAFSGKHDMVLATSGREALERLQENPEFDLVLCDLMMPDVSGSKVFEIVQRTHPQLVPRFAFMTGGAFTEKAQEFLERYHGHCIDKPFTIADVEQLLATVSAARLDAS